MSATSNRNLTLLSACQALLLANNSTAIALTGLVGRALTPDRRLATLPVTCWVLGGALTTYFASLLMQRIGRRGGFTVGAGAGAVGAAVCSLGVWLGDFWLFCAGMTAFGAYNAAAGYYRFAAAEAVPEVHKARAISLVLAGGLVGGVAGPVASRATVDLLPTLYLGAYLSLLPLLGIVFVLLRLLDLPPLAAAEAGGPARPIRVIVSQPTFVVAVASAALGYGVMNLLMTATPLAMGTCGHAYDATAIVIASHVVGMFAPSFVTGSLVQRFGALRVMLAGVALNSACVAVALAGIAVAHFWWALVLLGVGWNFLFVGSTTLLTETYQPSERARAQGANDLTIFVTMALSSLLSGLILEGYGWRALNLAALPLVGAIGIAILWLGAQRRGDAGQGTAAS